MGETHYWSGPTEEVDRDWNVIPSIINTNDSIEFTLPLIEDVAIWDKDKTIYPFLHVIDVISLQWINYLLCSGKLRL